MNEQTIEAIVDELAPSLIASNMGKVFQLSRLSLAIDFRNRDGSYLLLAVDPQTGPRLYLIKRKVRELEKASLPSGSFAMTLYKRLAGARLVALEKDEGDRIVRFSFVTRDAAGSNQNLTLIAQFTGRAANLLLLDENGYVIDSLRQRLGQQSEGAVRYEAPTSPSTYATSVSTLQQGSFSSLSEAADAFYQELEAKRLFTSKVATARARLKKEVNQREKLRRHLNSDIENHGDAETHKRIGDLLLANIGVAKRQGNTVTVTDYYTEGTPQLELELDEHVTLQHEASRRFARYSKSRRAAGEIARRLSELERELTTLHERHEELERIVADSDLIALEDFLGEDGKKVTKQRGKKEGPEVVTGTRRYLSSDGYEILVGRAARDNDHLTFRIARPNDLWLHAADYPGSHVIVLNPTRKDVPHRTIIEAAQLAAKFSQAKRDGKVDVHYTLRKYLAKPKGSPSGLVRMSSFKTIIVEPLESVPRA